MKHLFVIFNFILLTSCQSLVSTKKNVKLFNDSDVTYMYIYKTDSISAESKVVDSLKLLKTGYEKSLVLYSNIDSVSKTVDGFVCLNIFKLNNEKFAIIIDTNIKVYKYNQTKYERILTIQGELGFSNIDFEKIDVNADTYKDILVKLPSGGTYGDAYICLFYDPSRKTLIYDAKTELANVKLDAKERRVECFYSNSSTVYSIEKFSFRKIEQKKYLGKTTGNRKFDNYVEISKFGGDGKILKIDTLKKDTVCENLKYIPKDSITKFGTKIHYVNIDCKYKVLYEFNGLTRLYDTLFDCHFEKESGLWDFVPKLENETRDFLIFRNLLATSSGNNPDPMEYSIYIMPKNIKDSIFKKDYFIIDTADYIVYGDESDNSLIHIFNLESRKEQICELKQTPAPIRAITLFIQKIAFINKQIIVTYESQNIETGESEVVEEKFKLEI